MSFFSTPLAPKTTDPLADLPASGKTAFADHPQGNATITVQAIKPIQSKKTSYVGICFECSLQVDGAASELVGGKPGTAGVDLMVTIVPSDGGALEAQSAGMDARKLLNRYGAAYEATGHPLKVNAEGFYTPDGLSLNDDRLKAALESIVGKSWRVVAWRWAKGSGVEYSTPASAFPDSAA